MQKSWASKASTVLAIANSILLCIYVGVYAGLSANGRYEPALLGLDHVKLYGWAPAGFYEANQWNGTRMRAFFPLYFLDRCYWHHDSGGWDQGRAEKTIRRKG